jgi:hypothetical protein
MTITTDSAASGPHLLSSWDWDAVTLQEAPGFLDETGAASALVPDLSARLCRDQFAHFGHERIGDLHEGLAWILEGSLVFGNGLVLRLSLVVRQHLAYAILVPTRWKVALLHSNHLRRRRLRYAINGLPVNSQAVITNTLSLPASGT